MIRERFTLKKKKRLNISSSCFTIMTDQNLVYLYYISPSINTKFMQIQISWFIKWQGAETNMADVSKCWLLRRQQI